MKLFSSDGSRWIDPGVDTCGATVIYDPRPEFDHVQHNAPNPILTDMRSAGRDDWAQMLRVFTYVTSEACHYVTRDWVQITDPDAILHAHRVLSRLAALEATAEAQR